MGWYIKVEDVSEILEDIEKKLYACGKDSSVSIVRRAFAYPQKSVWIADSKHNLVCELNLTLVDQVIDEK